MLAMSPNSNTAVPADELRMSLVSGISADETVPLAPPLLDYGATSEVKNGNHRRILTADSDLRRRLLIKTQVSFFEDLKKFSPGSVPHSMIVALSIGLVCGIAAYLYYAFLFWALDFLWKDLPNRWWTSYDSSLTFLWIPIVSFTMAMGVGLTVVFLGDPGDLPYTVKCVHNQGIVAMSHVIPMVLASQCSILAGGSLGPEAPLVAICAALGGFMSRYLFRIDERNLVRKHTLMGMAGALAAFFGCPLGGSLFALEVNSRFGIEYFEHTVEAIFCGEMCLAVFRSLAGLPIQSIWSITSEKLQMATSLDVLYGTFLGVVGAGVAWIFAKFHTANMTFFRRYGLLDDKRAITRAMLGTVVIVILGLLVPHSMFWGELEFQTIATLGPADSLAHVWPTSGLLGFELKSAWSALALGFVKLIAISFTVAGGMRGGYIFPLFAAGAALGRFIYFLCPFIPVQLCILCLAAAINVAITRTAIATTLILSYLSGEQCALSSILASSLVSLLLTGYMPFIKSQMVRADLEASIYFESHEMDGDNIDGDVETPDSTFLHKTGLTPFIVPKTLQED